VAHCGNPWLCPVCAPIIAERRRQEIRSILEWGSADGLQFLFPTFTARHTRNDSLKDLLELFYQALRHFKQSRLVRSVFRSIGYYDSITGKDVTWGAANGWHPHQHEFWCCNLPESINLQEVASRLEEQWLVSLRKFGLDGEPGVAFKLKLLDLKSSHGADEYLAKVGTAADLSGEITGSSTVKTGRKTYKENHYSPLELLHLVEQGKSWARGLWLEFADAYYDRRQVVIGRKLRAIFKDLFGTVPNDDFETVQQEAAIKPDETIVINLEPGWLDAIYHFKEECRVLELVEQGLIDEAANLLRHRYEELNHQRYLKAAEVVKAILLLRVSFSAVL
jgi:hypothetical protein